MRHFVWFISLALSAAEVSPQAYIAHVRYLASPELKGRATGSPELEKAATYIAAQFKSFGLKPADGKDFELPFPVTIDSHLGKDNKLRWVFDDKNESESQSQFQPFSFSSSGKIEAPVVFAGYGITSNDLHYDDYAGVDVKVKIVLI